MKKNILAIVGLSLFVATCYPAPDITNDTEFPAKISVNFLNNSCSNSRDLGSDVLVKPDETKHLALDECALTQISAVVDIKKDNTWSVTAAPYARASAWTGEKFRLVQDEKYKENGGGFGVEKVKE
ncbi:hypothetical protein JST99_00525 [Candidatus Dependentiae bacterium]|nr:hypothetical protein [Candidatus Dependentiae bacterium]